MGRVCAILVLPEDVPGLMAIGDRPEKQAALGRGDEVAQRATLLLDAAQLPVDVGQALLIAGREPEAVAQLAAPDQSLELGDQLRRRAARAALLGRVGVVAAPPDDLRAREPILERGAVDADDRAVQAPPAEPGPETLPGRAPRRAAAPG